MISFTTLVLRFVSSGDASPLYYFDTGLVRVLTWVSGGVCFHFFFLGMKYDYIFFFLALVARNPLQYAATILSCSVDLSILVIINCDIMNLNYTSIY